MVALAGMLPVAAATGDCGGWLNGTAPGSQYLVFQGVNKLTGFGQDQDCIEKDGVSPDTTYSFSTLLLNSSDLVVGSTTVRFNISDTTRTPETCSPQWGQLADCGGNVGDAYMSLDLTGTPFAFPNGSASWHKVGFDASDTLKCDSTGQQCNSSFNAYCGGLHLNSWHFVVINQTQFDCALTQKYVCNATQKACVPVQPSDPVPGIPLESCKDACPY